MITNDAMTEVFCGVAKLPKEMASAEPSSYLAIEMAVDMKRQVVTDLAFTACPKLVESLLTTILLGKGPVDGVKEAVPIIERRHHSLGKRAVIAALKNSVQEYQSGRQPLQAVVNRPSSIPAV